MTKIKVSKIDAVRRQLDCAIKLWINDDDPVSIHTLTFAAFEIIDDLNKKTGNVEVTMLGMAQRHAAPDRVEELMKAFRKPMQFFKHANRDPHAILEFDSKSNNFLILMAIHGFKELGQQGTDLQHAFVTWMVLHNPKLSKNGESAFIDAGIDQIEGMRAMSKRDFFDAFLRGLAVGRIEAR